MKKNILVVAAHPDDEVLGCGASISKWSKNGHKVNILLMSEGITARDSKRNFSLRKEELDKHKNKAKKAAKILGAKSVNFCNFPDNRMDSIDLLDVTKSIEKFVKTFKPQLIVTHNHSDLNIDHKITHEACITATRPQNKNSVKEILTFEVPSSTEWNFSLKQKNIFNPNYFENVSGFLKKKIKALECYKSEMRKWPHPRSYKAIQHLAKWRGATIGVEEAEAFELVRKIND